MYLKSTSPWMSSSNKTSKGKIKTSQDKINFLQCNANASADVNADADAVMPMPRFPNGLLILKISAREICEMFVYKHSETIEFVKK